MAECKKSDFTLLYLAMIYVGMFIFLYGFVSRWATKGTTKFLGVVLVMLILVGATMWVYDTGSARVRTDVQLTGVRVRAKLVHVRTEPSTRSKQTILGTVRYGTQLPAFTKQGRWYEVQYEGRTAYVHGALVARQTAVSKTSTRKWPNMPVVMAVFGGLYLCVVVDAYRQHARAMRAWASA